MLFKGRLHGYRTAEYATEAVRCDGLRALCGVQDYLGGGIRANGNGAAPVVVQWNGLLRGVAGEEEPAEERLLPSFARPRRLGTGLLAGRSVGQTIAFRGL